MNTEELVSQIFWKEPENSSEEWGKYLAFMTSGVNEIPEKLDVHDPLKRNYQDFSLSENAKYISAFESGESYRVIFGRFKKSKIRFSITLWGPDLEGLDSLNIYYRANQIGIATKIFDDLVALFSPVYAYIDMKFAVSAKRRADGFAVDLRSELVGIFWTTYFCEQYVNFWGENNIRSIDGVACLQKAKGKLLRFSEEPWNLTATSRTAAEIKLEELSFVNPLSTLLKPIGKHIPDWNGFLHVPG